MNADYLRQHDYIPTKRYKTYTIFHNPKKGIILLHNDGKYEGFIKIGKSHVKKLQEGLRQAIETFILIASGILYLTSDITIIDGVSMEPTLKNHQIIIKSKTSESVKKMLIDRGAIIKFKSPDGDTAIKRIVAEPGDEIELSGWTVKVNGKIIDNDNREAGESQLSTMIKNKKRGDYSQKFILQPNQYYVMGDNRSNSIDSRKYGAISGDKILTVLSKSL